MIIAMLVLNITEVQNQSLIKYLGADDLAHTQLDPQWSHGGAGDGRSRGTGQTRNIHDISKISVLIILPALSSWSSD